MRFILLTLGFFAVSAQASILDTVCKNQKLRSEIRVKEIEESQKTCGPTRIGDLVYNSCDGLEKSIQEEKAAAKLPLLFSSTGSLGGGLHMVSAHLNCKTKKLTGEVIESLDRSGLNSTKKVAPATITYAASQQRQVNGETVIVDVLKISIGDDSFDLSLSAGDAVVLDPAKANNTAGVLIGGIETGSKNVFDGKFVGTIVLGSVKPESVLKNYGKKLGFAKDYFNGFVDMSFESKGGVEFQTTATSLSYQIFYPATVTLTNVNVGDPRITYAQQLDYAAILTELARL